MAKLNLTQLRAAGVVSREPVKHEVPWEHTQAGETLTDTFDVWVIPASLGSELSIHKEVEKDREYVLTALSKRVQLEDDKGKKIFLSYEEWSNFDATLALAIFKVMREASEAPKNSQLPTNSFANSSPAESAVAA